MSREGVSEAQAVQRLEQLIGAYGAALASYVRRRAPADDVDDVLAETFLVAWRRIEDMPHAELAWLFGVARKVIATQRRAADRRDSLELRLHHASSRDTQIEAVAEGLSTPVDVALSLLTEKDREALMLIACEGLRPREAASAMGEKPSAFYVRLHRAKRRLKRLLIASELAQPQTSSTRIPEAKESAR